MEPSESLYGASLRILEDGHSSWRSHLMDCVDAVRRSRSTAGLEAPPSAELEAPLRALMAGTAEVLAAECGAGAPPPWTADVGPLDRPWFVSGYENLKAAALVESPVAYRSRNIFVLGNFLDRA